MQVELSGAGKWPYFTSAYRNPLFLNIPKCYANVNKLKDRRNFSLAELNWKGMVGNLHWKEM